MYIFGKRGVCTDHRKEEPKSENLVDLTKNQLEMGEEQIIRHIS